MPSVEAAPTTPIRTRHKLERVCSRTSITGPRAPPEGTGVAVDATRMSYRGRSSECGPTSDHRRESRRMHCHRHGRATASVIASHLTRTTCSPTIIARLPRSACGEAVPMHRIRSSSSTTRCHLAHRSFAHGDGRFRAPHAHQPSAHGEGHREPHSSPAHDDDRALVLGDEAGRLRTKESVVSATVRMKCGRQAPTRLWVFHVKQQKPHISGAAHD